jgi:site-specific recombinase XerD
MSYSVSLTYNKQRITKGNLATIYLRVIIDRKKHDINLDFKWDVTKINQESQRLLPAAKNDIVCEDYNMIIKTELSKINEIFRLARLGFRTIDINQFKKEYENFESREDFITIWKATMEERLAQGIIKKSTRDSNSSSLEALKKFMPKLIFAEINVKLLERYKAFLANDLKYDSDTMFCRLKDFRTYLNIAIEAGYICEYPFKKFKMPKEQSSMIFLNEEEFQKLKQYFYSGTLVKNTNKEKCLRAFLFICYTGLRISDLMARTHKDIIHGVLTFKPQKNSSGNQKKVEVPLNEEARKLIETEKGKLFILPSDAKMREELSEIAQKIGLTQTCSPHQARHTFATRFLSKGGRLEVLQQLLGHEDITTTMKYVHIDKKQKVKEINYLD